MKAWVYRRYGSPDVLAFEEVEEKVPGPKDIRIRVRASGLNAADWHIMRADPFLARIAVGLRKPRRPMIIGSDVAGIVESVGDKVSGFSPGDSVYAETMMMGGCAELIVVPEDNKTVVLSARNIPGVSVRRVSDLNSYDVISHRRVLLTKRSAEMLAEAAK